MTGKQVEKNPSTLTSHSCSELQQAESLPRLFFPELRVPLDPINLYTHLLPVRRIMMRVLVLLYQLSSQSKIVVFLVTSNLQTKAED